MRRVYSNDVAFGQNVRLNTRDGKRNAVVVKVTKKNFLCIDPGEPELKFRAPKNLVELIEDPKEQIDVFDELASNINADIEDFNSKASGELPDWLMNLENYFESTPKSIIANGFREVDNGRKKVYASERIIWKNSDYSEFKDLDEAISYVHYVMSSRWFIDKFGIVPLEIVRTRSEVKSYVTKLPDKTLRMAISDIHLKEWVLLHEIAHTVGIRQLQSHGRLWRRIYVELVREFQSEGTADRLENMFFCQNLPVDKPSKPRKDIRRLLDGQRL